MMSRRNGGGGIGTTLTDALLQRTGTFDGDRVSAVGAQINCIGKVPTDIAGKSRRLFLSNNSISSLRGVEQFPLLDSLSVAHNEIKYLEELYFLKFLTGIKKLTLVGNLVTKVPFYADFVLGHCPNLLYLDNIKISDEDRMRAKVNYRRACQYISRAITNSIRNSLLGQIVGMRLCQQDMLCSVFGRFVFLHSSHVGNLQPPGDVPLVDLLRILKASGLFQRVLSLCEAHLSKELQHSLLRIRLDHLQTERRELSDDDVFRVLFATQEVSYAEFLQENDSIELFAETSHPVHNTQYAAVRHSLESDVLGELLDSSNRHSLQQHVHDHPSRSKEVDTVASKGVEAAKSTLLPASEHQQRGLLQHEYNRLLTENPTLLVQHTKHLQQHPSQKLEKSRAQPQIVRANFRLSEALPSQLPDPDSPPSKATTRQRLRTEDREQRHLQSTSPIARKNYNNPNTELSTSSASAPIPVPLPNPLPHPLPHPLPPNTSSSATIAKIAAEDKKNKPAFSADDEETEQTQKHASVGVANQSQPEVTANSSSTTSGSPVAPISLDTQIQRFLLLAKEPHEDQLLSAAQHEAKQHEEIWEAEAQRLRQVQHMLRNFLQNHEAELAVEDSTSQLALGRSNEPLSELKQRIQQLSRRLILLQRKELATFEHHRECRDVVRALRIPAEKASAAALTLLHETVQRVVALQEDVQKAQIWLAASDADLTLFQALTKRRDLLQEQTASDCDRYEVAVLRLRDETQKSTKVADDLHKVSGLVNGLSEEMELVRRRLQVLQHSEVRVRRRSLLRMFFARWIDWQQVAHRLGRFAQVVRFKNQHLLCQHLFQRWRRTQRSLVQGRRLQRLLLQRHLRRTFLSWRIKLFKRRRVDVVVRRGQRRRMRRALMCFVAHVQARKAARWRDLSLQACSSAFLVLRIFRAWRRLQREEHTMLREVAKEVQRRRLRKALASWFFAFSEAQTRTENRLQSLKQLHKIRHLVRSWHQWRTCLQHQRHLQGFRELRRSFRRLRRRLLRRRLLRQKLHASSTKLTPSFPPVSHVHLQSSVDQRARNLLLQRWLPFATHARSMQQLMRVALWHGTTQALRRALRHWRRSLLRRQSLLRASTSLTQRQWPLRKAMRHWRRVLASRRLPLSSELGRDDGVSPMVERRKYPAASADSFIASPVATLPFQTSSAAETAHADVRTHDRNFSSTETALTRVQPYPVMVASDAADVFGSEDDVVLENAVENGAEEEDDVYVTHLARMLRHWHFAARKERSLRRLHRLVTERTRRKRLLRCFAHIQATATRTLRERFNTYRDELARSLLSQNCDLSAQKRKVADALIPLRETVQQRTAQLDALRVEIAACEDVESAQFLVLADLSASLSVWATQKEAARRSHAALVNEVDAIEQGIRYTAGATEDVALRAQSEVIAARSLAVQKEREALDAFHRDVDERLMIGADGELERQTKSVQARTVLVSRDHAEALQQVEHLSHQKRELEESRAHLVHLMQASQEVFARTTTEVAIQMAECEEAIESATRQRQALEETLREYREEEERLRNLLFPSELPQPPHESQVLKYDSRDVADTSHLEEGDVEEHAEAQKLGNAMATRLDESFAQQQDEKENSVNQMPTDADVAVVAVSTRSCDDSVDFIKTRDHFRHVESSNNDSSSLASDSGAVVILITSAEEDKESRDIEGSGRVSLSSRSTMHEDDVDALSRDITALSQRLRNRLLPPSFT